MQLCIKLLEKALFDLPLLGIDVNKKPCLFARFQPNKSNYRNKALFRGGMICIGKEPVLTVYDPRDTVSWANGEPSIVFVESP